MLVLVEFLADSGLLGLLSVVRSDRTICLETRVPADPPLARNSVAVGSATINHKAGADGARGFDAIDSDIGRDRGRAAQRPGNAFVDRAGGHFFAISKPSPIDFSATISTEATPSRRAKALGWQTHPRGDIGRQRVFRPVANPGEVEASCVFRALMRYEVKQHDFKMFEGDS